MREGETPELRQRQSRVGAFSESAEAKARTDCRSARSHTIGSPPPAAATACCAPSAVRHAW